MESGAVLAVNLIPPVERLRRVGGFRVHGPLEDSVTKVTSVTIHGERRGSPSSVLIRGIPFPSVSIVT